MHVKGIVNEGNEEAVSIDLKSFFDEIPHGLILKLLRRQIKDENFITLIADDFIILVRSERSAIRVMDNTIKYLETDLQLPVNKDKSKTDNIRKVTFLGFSLLIGKIRISTEAKKTFKEKVKGLTKRNNPLSMYQIIMNLNQLLRGWINYFEIQEFKRALEELDWFIRSRPRSMQLKKWKKPKRFQKEMRRAGYSVEDSKRIWVKMNKWKSAHRAEVKFTLKIEWLRKYGLITLKDYSLVKS